MFFLGVFEGAHHGRAYSLKQISVDNASGAVTTDLPHASAQGLYKEVQAFIEAGNSTSTPGGLGGGGRGSGSSRNRRNGGRR